MSLVDNLEHAMRDAQSGSTMAGVAVTVAMDGAGDWPEAFRETACRWYELPAHQLDGSVINEAASRVLARDGRVVA